MKVKLFLFWKEDYRGRIEIFASTTDMSGISGYYPAGSQDVEILPDSPDLVRAAKKEEARIRAADLRERLAVALQEAGSCEE